MPALTTTLGFELPRTSPVAVVPLSPSGCKEAEHVFMHLCAGPRGHACARASIAAPLQLARCSATQRNERQINAGIAMSGSPGRALCKRSPVPRRSLL
eukprot:CAMPEP_0204607986 /NCGR_PEP_ID=MMETSP0661-20131031/60043_1 /ASSEMBLY_ACC=CAM_ASM_000606 /TAXON_ID=109239 /ORGANISM="Alexandrium margalefi, Strain AMGDE01CS-322" /LENGTH=97 /DNA_ID=CAMNT_0051619455 /DNA_START=164 /DNA_END=457 /DNA_ORIENTATION=-